MRKLSIAIVFGILALFFAGCGSGSGNGNNNNNNNNDDNQNSDKGQLLITVFKDDDGKYNIDREIIKGNYPYKIIANGKELQYIGDESYNDIVPAGNLTYSIIYDGDTLTRKNIKLSDKTYSFDDNSTETEWRFFVNGGNGDEKIFFSAYLGIDENGKEIYYRKVFPITQEVIVSKNDAPNNLLPLCVVPNNFELIAWENLDNNYATAQSKKIAVFEYIVFQEFIFSNE